MQKISNVNLSVAIGDYTGSNIENWIGGEEHLLKLNLKDVEMLPKFWENKNANTYNLHIIKGYQNDKGAQKAFNYVLMHPNRFTDDTMFTFALMHVLVLYRKKYGLDKGFDPENFKKYMDELLIDYTEMLLQYYKAYGKMAVLGPMMRKLWDNYLKGIPKDELKERINDLKNNPGKIVNKNDKDRAFYCKSWANGAAMHVSPVAFAARCMEELDFMIEQTTKNTHDHPESIKGAKCVGQFIFLGRINWSKESIKRWIQYKFSTNEYLPDEYIPGRKIDAIQGKYDMNITLEEIRQKYKRELRCKYTVTPALIAVLEANSFKEAVDNARSIGGDCDTICAIAAQMAATLWPINQEYTKTVKEYMLDIETEEQINLDNVNGEKRVILCRNTKGKNILFQNVNDEYEKNFGGYYRDSAPIEWQLKNTLSIVKDLHNDIKNIATDEKRQYLIDLINSIEDDLKQFQNTEDMSTKNLLVEIQKEINKLETEVQNLDVKDNYSEGRIKTPEGFYESTKVVNKKHKMEIKVNNLLKKADDVIFDIETEFQNLNLNVKDNSYEGRTSTPEGFYESTKVVNKKHKMEIKNLSTRPENPKQVVNAVEINGNNLDKHTEQTILSEESIDETQKASNKTNQGPKYRCFQYFQFLIYRRTKMFIFILIGFVSGTPLSVYFAINLMRLYSAVTLTILLFTICLLIKTIIEFKQSKTKKFYDNSSKYSKTVKETSKPNEQIHKKYDFENTQPQLEENDDGRNDNAIN